eukprot:518690-Prorocentrum_minimum.AAC.1
MRSHRKTRRDVTGAERNVPVSALRRGEEAVRARAFPSAFSLSARGKRPAGAGGQRGVQGGPRGRERDAVVAAAVPPGPAHGRPPRAHRLRARLRRGRRQVPVPGKYQSDAGSAGIFSRWTNQTQ